MGIVRKLNIAFLGCDSTHVEAYAKVLKRDEFRERATVTCLWGKNKAQSKAKAAELQIDTCLETLDAMELKGIDLCLVLGRYGKDHIYPALSSIAAGIPTYIDKPFADKLEDADAIITAATDRSVPIMSFSALKYADEVIAAKALMQSEKEVYLIIATCPFNTNSISDLADPGFSFYAIHAVDMLLEVAGSKISGIRSVCENSNGILANIAFESGLSGILNLPYSSEEIFRLSCYSRSGIHDYDINLDGEFYANTISVLLDHLVENQTEIAPIRLSREAIALLNEIEKVVALQKINCYGKV